MHGVIADEVKAMLPLHNDVQPEISPRPTSRLQNAGSHNVVKNRLKIAKFVMHMTYHWAPFAVELILRARCDDG